jgi:hypothetical protein
VPTEMVPSQLREIRMRWVASAVLKSTFIGPAELSSLRSRMPATPSKRPARPTKKGVPGRVKFDLKLTEKVISLIRISTDRPLVGLSAAEAQSWSDSLSGLRAAVIFRAGETAKLALRYNYNGRNLPQLAALRSAAGELEKADVVVSSVTVTGVWAAESVRRKAAWEATVPYAFTVAGVCGFAAAGYGWSVMVPAMAAGMIVTAVTGRLLWTK